MSESSDLFVKQILSIKLDYVFAVDLSKINDLKSTYLIYDLNQYEN